MTTQPFQPGGLIRAQGPMSFGSKGPALAPDVTLVYWTRSGQAEILDRRPHRHEASRYQAWYAVDNTRHHDSIIEHVSSAVGSMLFRARMGVIWGVEEPAKIVQHGTRDGLALVRSKLIEMVQNITRGFDIDNVASAEHRLQQEFRRGPLPLPEGLTIFSVVVGLRSDDHTARFEISRREQQRAGISDEETFKRLRKQEQANAAMESDRIGALRQIAQGEDDLLFLFLSRHPDQVGVVLEQVSKRREINLQAQISLFEKMVAEGFIQEADIETMRRILINPLEQVADGNTRGMLQGTVTQTAITPASAPAPSPQPAPPPAAGDTGAGDAGVAGWVRFGSRTDNREGG
ncbi:hypothetical protein [Herbidospora mongoliensis]|uniref:hypothetical protein n=1 Tax=Herbidospora mongoliensis TaxID=688067 RepID=UPI00083044C7|nr:hypothetical protein [Herbidospora mongoliensis]